MSIKKFKYALDFKNLFGYFNSSRFSLALMSDFKAKISEHEPQPETSLFINFFHHHGIFSDDDPGNNAARANYYFHRQ